MYNFTIIFSSLPKELIERLEEHYLKIKHNFARSHYEPSELNGGKFGEIVFRILECQNSGGSYTALGQSLDTNKLIKQLESNPALDDAVRFHIPRVLLATYSIRNKRGVAHHAGEISPNHMDATFIVAATDWVMAELVRLFHGVDIKTATSLVEALTTKQIPIIWEVGNHKRVISPPNQKLSSQDKALLLLYNASPQAMEVADLIKFAEYGNTSRFRKEILTGLHRQDFIHFDRGKDTAVLSPLGIEFVEKNLPLNF